MAERQVRTGTDTPCVRTFTDEEGHRWEVLEVDGRVVPAARGERCLIFRASHAIRRVWSYPAEWASLSPPELRQLSWNR